MIKFENITKEYAPNIVALDNVSFEIKKGEFVSIVGKSGAGKTTLFKLLLAEERPTKGRVFFGGQNVQKIKRVHLPFLRRRIGSIFQDYKLLSFKTIYENIAYVMEVTGAEQKEIENDVFQVLDIIGLRDKPFHFPKELSAGERQRVVIARALIHRPEVILADEPTGNLDPFNTSDIIRLLLKINELGTTVVLATHDKNIVDGLERRVVTLEDGKVVKDEKKGRFVLRS